MTTAALIADIHANAPALEAVLKEFEVNPSGGIWCAGDLVGYNSYVREALAMVRAARIESVHGNHDLMVAGRLPTTGIGPRARRGVEWARGVLSHDDRDWLAALPSLLFVGDGVICMHSMLGDPERRMERREQYRDQADILRRYDPSLRMCITGHTHLAGAVRVAPDGTVESHRSPRVSVEPDGFWFVNPGSVGEPRDGDTRASYATLDLASNVVRFHRVKYSRMRVTRMNAIRLPPLESTEPANRFVRWMRSAFARVSPRLSLRLS